MVNQSLVLRINICGKNRHLRQAPNVTGHAKRRHNQQKNERENGQTKCQRFAKLKELQSQAQADTICSTFNFAQSHPSPPTTRLLDKFADC
ncbi:MAG: hypothetical protein IPI59_16220 [Sphingobacteriales bacterium]|nr:hypothetical protein [Sphingobacteriales bacterium]MBK7529030.1 hypothetical protein [Sphingobacteriales bacterium]MBK8678986.1 hypothetical protein [Sphingobacteriales bacterium]